MKVLSVRSKKLFLIVRILVCGLKVIGLAPFAISVETSTKLVDYQTTRIQAFRFSETGLVYNLLLVILIVILAAFKFLPQFTLQTDPRLASDTIDQFIKILEKVLMFLSASIILASWGFGQDNAASIMNRLLEVDAKLSSLKEQPFDKWALTFLIVHVTFNGYLWIYVWVYLLRYESFYEFLKSFFNLFPHYVVYWFIIEYFTIVGLVARELQTVNKYLLNFEELGNYLSRPSVRSHPLAAEIFLTSGSNKLASLRLLRRVRTTLFELCKDVASFFSLPILFAIACFCVSILTQAYWIFIAIEREHEHLSFARSASWILAIFSALAYPVVSLALNVTWTTTEVGLTGHVVNKLLAVARRRSEIRQELKEFSLQLLHERVNFTACGFFSLDSTLMQTVLGGIATYFIVLVQFRSSINCQSPNIAP